MQHFKVVRFLNYKKKVSTFRINRCCMLNVTPGICAILMYRTTREHIRLGRRLGELRKYTYDKCVTNSFALPSPIWSNRNPKYEYINKNKNTRHWVGGERQVHDQGVTLFAYFNVFSILYVLLKFCTRI